jgi:hypothetical protein
MKSTVLRAGDHQRQVEHHDALVAQYVRHLAVDDPLREAFHDRGLAHAGLAEQDGVVLRAT